jgi:hypothetical protein
MCNHATYLCHSANDYGVWKLLVLFGKIVLQTATFGEVSKLLVTESIAAISLKKLRFVDGVRGQCRNIIVYETFFPKFKLNS